jgi:hypothetical protein
MIPSTQTARPNRCADERAAGRPCTSIGPAILILAIGAASVACPAMGAPGGDGRDDLGAAFVEQNRARGASNAFVAPALPSAGGHRAGDDAPADAPRAFLRYRLGYTGAAAAAGGVETQAIAGLRWHRLLLVHEVGVTGAEPAAAARSRTALALDWAEASTRMTVGDVSVARPAAGGDALRLVGVGIRRASTPPADLAVLAPGSGATALAGEVTLSADADGRYVAALRQEAVATSRPAVLPGFASALLTSAATPPMPSAAALAASSTGLDRALAPLPPAGATEIEYAMGTERAATPVATAGEGRETFIASVRSGVTDELSVGAEAEGRDGRRDGALGFAMALGSAGAVRGSVGAARNAQGDACATGRVDYRVAQGAVEVSAAYARGLADLPAVRGDAAAAPVQSVGGRVRVALNATDSLALASDRASSAEAAPVTATRVTFRRTIAPTMALDGVVGYVSGAQPASGAVPEGWLASLSVRWSLDPAPRAARF